MFIAVQVTVTAALCGASWGAVAACQMGDGGLDLSLEDIDLRPGLMPKLKELTEDFWRRVKEKDPYAPDFKKDVGLIADLYDGEGGPVLELGADAEVVGWLDAWQALKARESDGAAAARECKTLRAKLIDKLGNASGARMADGRTFTVKITRRKAFSVEATQFPQLTVKAAA